jgi:hypothetical protein
MFLIALGMKALARWNSAEREKRTGKANPKDLTEKLSQEARNDEGNATI